MSETFEIDRGKLEQLIEQEVNEQLQSIGRRRFLQGAIATATAGGIIVGTSGSAGAAPADASGTVYFEQIGDSSNPVSTLYVDQQIVSDTQESATIDDLTVTTSASGAVIDTAQVLVDGSELADSDTIELKT